MLVSDFLLTGEKNAQTRKDLCQILHMNPRVLTVMIELERRNGIPICASTGTNPGYYLAANKAEMQRFCDSLRHRAGEIYKTRKACLRTIEQLPEREA